MKIKKEKTPINNSIERLARNLSSKIQLSFDEKNVSSFLRQIKLEIIQVRNSYKILTEIVLKNGDSNQSLEVLFDNFPYIINNALTEIEERCKNKKILHIPQMEYIENKTYPRTYIIAKEFVKLSKAEINRENLINFLLSYQRYAPLSIRELDIFPDMLRLVLIEEIFKIIKHNLITLESKDDAEKWFLKISKTLKRKNDPKNLSKITLLLAEKYKIVPLSFSHHLLEQITQSGNDKDFRIISKWLKLTLYRQGNSHTQLSNQIIKTERVHTKTITNSVNSLRWLTHVRWYKISKSLNAIDKILSQDPAEIFETISDETRGMYHRSIIRIADRVGIHDIEIAKEAIKLAQLNKNEKNNSNSARANHVGYFLIDDGLSELEKKFSYRETIIEFIRRKIFKNSTLFYFTIFVFTTLLLTIFLFVLNLPYNLEISKTIFTLIFGLLVSSEIATTISHFIFTKLLNPHILPSLNLENGVGEKRRTFLVMPSMFRNEESTKKLIKKLETNYIVNKDPDIFFAALMDFQDGNKETEDKDSEMVEKMKIEIAKLNNKYPCKTPRFSMFYRKRIWNETEKKFMGWERKRGKLREFNNLLRNKNTSYIDNANKKISAFGFVKFVITIDEDSELTSLGAQKLIGTIDHPLNKALVDSQKMLVTKGYGIIEPKIALRFADSSKSIFSRLFGNFPGIDSYSWQTSDLQQNLFKKGIFHGKGIYDIDIVEKTMADKIPENSVLSHDLLEGLYARVGVTNEAYVFEGFPSNYCEYMKRSHRWIRGDWQIMKWLFTKRGSGFPAIDRWRIFDNLRRSILPIIIVFGIYFSMFYPPSILLWSIIVLTTIGSNVIFSALINSIKIITSLNKKINLKYRIKTTIKEFFYALIKTIFYGIFVLNFAIVHIDAIFTSLWRMFISKKKLLEWQTAYETAWKSNSGLKTFILFMWRGLIISFILFLYFIYNIKLINQEFIIFTWLLLWILAPIFAALLSYQFKNKVELKRKDDFLLRKIAIRTYWFYTDLVTEKTHWLVPDHFQEIPIKKINPYGIGLSPTNLGMYLLSLSSARNLGIGTITDFANRVDRAFESLSGVERYRGHFYNWYELKKLTPLLPKYISSVDSANLSLSFLALCGSIENTIESPLISKDSILGLDSGLSVLFDICKNTLKQKNLPKKQKLILEKILKIISTCRSLIIKKIQNENIDLDYYEDIFPKINAYIIEIKDMLYALRIEDKNNTIEKIFIATQNIKKISSEFCKKIEDYCGYAIHKAPSFIINNEEVKNIYLNLYYLLKKVPSLEELSSGKKREEIEKIAIKKSIILSSLSTTEKKQALEWFEEVLFRLSNSEEKACIVRKQLLKTSERARAYFDEMDFEFLYDKERGLFHGGYNVLLDSLDESFYDILASEANSVSIVGIIKRSAPAKHWSFLGRKIIKSRTSEVLAASWAGSLFEYLGTLIYFDVPRKSFWGSSAIRAINSHKKFAKKFSIPWGMGESASSIMNEDGDYHYQAFGDSSIGYKRDLSKFCIVSPYTTALSLYLDPKSAIKNLKTLIKEGAFGHYGFYDSIDYSKKITNPNESGKISKIYYAHHQGFILLSIVNIIKDGFIRKMINSYPEITIINQLLEEKMPDSPTAEKINITAPSIGNKNLQLLEKKSPQQYVATKTKHCYSKFISNGSYHVHITNTGAGNSKLENINLTHSCDDLIAENYGSFFYLFDKSRNALWSPTYMPTRTDGEKNSLSVGEELVVFKKTYEGISSSLSITVPTNNNIEIRELNISNNRTETANLIIANCSDISLMQKIQESSHPNYEKLFVKSESLWENRLIIASRHDPRDKNKMIYGGFLLNSSKKPNLLYSIRSKEIFFGSPAQKNNPTIIHNIERANAETPQFAIDTVAGFVTQITLKPGESCRISLVIAIANSKNTLMSTLKPLRLESVSHKIISKADYFGGNTLATLGISSGQANIFSSLASHLINHSECSQNILNTGNPPLINALWKCRISGNSPIILISVSDVSHLSIIKQLLLCRDYFIYKGIDIDIIIFNQHVGGYLKTFEDEIDFLLRKHQEKKPVSLGEIVHIRADQFSIEERKTLITASTIYIDTKKQNLSDALKALQKNTKISLPPKLITEHKLSIKKSKYNILKKNNSQKLIFDNGYGAYNEQKSEYIIQISPKKRPPVPWSNIVANENIGFVSTDRGSSFTWARNSHENKLTVAYNDPLSTSVSEAIYIRDDKSGKLFSPLPIVGPLDAYYEIAHGQGYSSYKTLQEKLSMDLKLQVHIKKPIKYFCLKIKNESDIKRHLTIFSYFELLLGINPWQSKKHIAFSVFKNNTILAEQAFHKTVSTGFAFAGISQGADSFSLSKKEFLGKNFDPRSPVACNREKLSSNQKYIDEPCIALSKQITLDPQEEKSIVLFLGEAESQKEAELLISKINIKNSEEKTSSEINTFWNNLPQVKVDLPDKELSVLFNKLLLYQTLTSRILGKSGFYQISGAFGFRDQLQDAMAMLWIDTNWVRSHIIECAAHQFKEGDVLSWWHPNNCFGARTRLSDHQLWLPYVVNKYIEFTGDENILEEKIAFLEGITPNENNNQSVVGIFNKSYKSDTLYNHCILAIEYSLTKGFHGLPLIGAADWNDAMNNVGTDGKGESIWLAWMTIYVLEIMSKMANKKNDIDKANKYKKYIENYQEAIEKHGWDEKWYIRAYTDSGIPIGTNKRKELKIDSICQSWSYFVNPNSPKSLEALESAKKELKINEGHTPLISPPLTSDTAYLGTISEYPPGVRENGSQYNHAALWLAQAFFASGNSSDGKIILDSVNPLKRTNTNKKVDIYRGEPYVVAADIYSQPTYPGRAGWTWYTASSGAMYITILEFMLGIKKINNELIFNPSIPSDWNSFKVEIKCGKAFYEINYEAHESIEDELGNTNNILIWLDNIRMEKNKIPFIDDGKTHCVVLKFLRNKSIDN